MMVQNSIKYFSILLLVVIINACNEDKSKEVPSNIVSEDVFVEMLKDIHIAESAVEKMRLEDVNSIIRHKKTFFLNVVNHYGLSQEDFNDNYNFYSKDVTNFSIIYDKVLEALSIEQALTEEKVTEKENQDKTENQN